MEVLRQSSYPHRMERSGLASRRGGFILGKELPVPLEREAWSSLGSICRLQRRRKYLAIPEIQPRPSSTQSSLYVSISLLITASGLGVLQ